MIRGPNNFIINNPIKSLSGNRRDLGFSFVQIQACIMWLREEMATRQYFMPERGDKYE